MIIIIVFKKSDIVIEDFYIMNGNEFLYKKFNNFVRLY